MKSQRSGELEEVSQRLGPFASLVLNSVGIDIGSATSHLLFSKLLMVRSGSSLQSRFDVAKRQITYASNVMLTPYKDHLTIDSDKLSDFIKRCYKDAGVASASIDTGAVIITGNASTKQNARMIVEIFSKEAGKFVCATAGPNFEAMIAAHGSGAVELSRRGGKSVLNIDIGGGTTKLALVKNGDVLGTAAINVGSRIVSFEASGRISRIEASAKIIAGQLGIPLILGGHLARKDKMRFAEAMVNALFDFIGGRKKPSGLVRRLAITSPIQFSTYDHFIFSGGVSEYVYRHEKQEYGDLGRELGEKVRERAIAEFDGRIVEPTNKIRATVVGASQYTIQLSGSTIHVSRNDLLPMRNMKVIRPHLGTPESLDARSIAIAIRKSLSQFDLNNTRNPIALALRWRFDPSYENVKSMAKGICAGLSSSIRKRLPIVLVFDSDIGGVIGQELQDLLGKSIGIVSLDEVDLGDLDFVDIGKEIGESSSVPIVVKSLVF